MVCFGVVSKLIDAIFMSEKTYYLLIINVIMWSLCLTNYLLISKQQKGNHFTQSQFNKILNETNKTLL